MDGLDRRKLKYFLRLNYPLHTTFGQAGIVAHYPDLLGCECRGVDLEKLRLVIDHRRLAWLTERIEAGDTPPMPNSHSDFRPDVDAVRLRPHPRAREGTGRG